jgi:Beta-1,3-glucanase/Bacterial Ig-like domain (group 3)
MLRLLTLFALFFIHCLEANPIPGPFDPPWPSFPDTPPYYDGVHLPIVFENRTGLPDTEIYIVVLGKDFETCASQAFVQFENKDGFNSVGELKLADSILLNGSQFTQSLSEFSQSNGQYIAYIPYIQSGIIYFSYGSVLDMKVVPTSAPAPPPTCPAGFGIQQPSPTDTSSDNYKIIFDVYEFNFDQNNNGQIFTNATAVSFHAIPLYAYLSTANTEIKTTGLFQPRNYILSCVEETFLAAPTAPAWDGLVLKDLGETLRIMSPGKGMNASTPLMDINYLDNAGTYGYSYIDDIWSGGAGSFYRTTPLVLEIPAGSFETYTGVIDAGTQAITWTSSPSGHVVTFDPPTTTLPTTTSMIFSGQDLTVTDDSMLGDGVQISKLFQEGIISSLVPTASTLSETYLTDNKASYYTHNSNLTPAEPTGPWYCLYSKALHGFGSIYTFAFDEPLWPDVQLVSDAFIEGSTFLAINLGYAESNPTSTTIESSENPQLVGLDVTFTATVTNDGTTTEPLAGTVTFTIDSVPGAPIALGVDNKSEFTTNSLTVGVHPVFATFTPTDPDIFDPSTSPTLPQVINSPGQTSTTTTMTSNNNPSLVNVEVTFPITVASSSGVGTPTGTVTVFIDGVEQAPPINLSGGTGEFKHTFTEEGQYSLFATYDGDTDFTGSTSEPINQIVNNPDPTDIATTTELSSSQNPSFTGTQVTFTATVTPVNGPPPVLTGNVSFLVKGVVEGPIPLINGQASFSTIFDNEGIEYVLAGYGGTSYDPGPNYKPSGSVLIEQIIGDFFPPANLVGVQKKNKFASQTEYVNRLRWNPPSIGSIPVKYEVYRNLDLSTLAGTVGGSSSRNAVLEFFDRRREPGKVYKYYVVSVSSGGSKSLPAEVVVTPLK